jgi:Glycoside Hydrolase Family 113
MTAPGRRAFAMLVGAALLLALVTACSIPSRPLWWPQPKHPAPPVGKAVTVPTVSDPWRPGMRQLGIQVYWTANPNDSSDAVVRAKAQRIIDYAIGLHANSIAVTFPFFTYGPTADTVFAGRSLTPSPRHIRVFLAAAAQAHMRVTLRPELSENALIAKNPADWRGSLHPHNRAAWFRSYRKMLVPYLVAAQEGHAASFVVGTELNSLEGAPQWPGLIRSFRSVYGGELAYDQNYDAFASHTENPPVQSYDVDAYPGFGLKDSASVARLTGAWDAWLGAHPLSVRRQLTLSEIGIQAVAGSYPAPWNWYSALDAPIDTRVQASWYRAACNAVSAEQIGGGIYWWEVNFDANPTAPRPFETDRLTFLDRPAQQVIRGCFAKLSSEQLGWKVLLHKGINPVRR